MRLVSAPLRQFKRLQERDFPPLRLQNVDPENRGRLLNSQLQYLDLQSEGQRFDNPFGIVVVAVKACGVLRDAENGKLLHMDACERDYCTDTFVATALVDMYANCRRMNDARQVFDNMRSHDLVSWNALIMGYAVNGESELALEIFSSLESKGCEANDRSFVAALTACADLAGKDKNISSVSGRAVKLKVLEMAMSLHSQAAEKGCDSNTYVGNSLVNVYAKCGSLEDARKIFDRMMFHNVVSWNTLILGYVGNGRNILALELFSCTELADARTFLAALMACGDLAAKEEFAEVRNHGACVKLKALSKGMEIHSRALKSGRSSDIFVRNALIDMYFKCRSIADAAKVFEMMPSVDVVTYNALMLGYAENGENELVLQLFLLVQGEGIADARTYFTALMACSGLAVKEEGRKVDGELVKIRCLQTGREIHRQAAECGFHTDIFVENCLMDMYVKCGSMVEALRVFNGMLHHDVVSWTTLIAGYADNGNSELALEVFWRMENSGCVPNARTFVAAVIACCGFAAREERKKVSDRLVKLKSLEKGMEIHAKAAKQGCDSDTFVANSLIVLYSRCGSLTDATKAFQRMNQRDVVSWNSLIMGYLENSESDLALDLFQGMSCVPNARTYVAAIIACGKSLVAASSEEIVDEESKKAVKLKYLEKLMSIHSQAAAEGLESNIFVTNALIDVYSKCDSILDARIVFDRAPCRNSESWSSLICGYVDNDESEVAAELFSCTEEAGIAPDVGIFIAAFMACGNLASLEAGRRIEAEVYRSGLENDADSAVLVTCMVDFHGKCGDMVTARHIFDSGLLQRPDTVLCNALMSGFARCGDADSVLELVRSMKDEGVERDCVSYLCVLNACSHGGLVEEGRRWFDSVIVEPNLKQYSCVIDMLGRANRVEEAVEMVKKEMKTADVVCWMSILGACWKWKNVGVARSAFDELKRLDDEQGAAYSLMANIVGC